MARERQKPQQVKPGNTLGFPYTRPLKRGADQDKLAKEITSNEKFRDLVVALKCTPWSAIVGLKRELTTAEMERLNDIIDDHVPMVPAYPFRGKFNRQRVQQELTEELGKEVVMSVTYHEETETLRVLCFREATDKEYGSMEEVIKNHDPEDDPEVKAQQATPQSEMLDLVGKSPLRMNGRQLALLLMVVADRVGLLDENGNFKGG